MQLLYSQLGCAAVILMEGGTVYDLQVLDETKKEETKSSGTFYWCMHFVMVLVFTWLEDAAGGGEDDTKSEVNKSCPWLPCSVTECGSSTSPIEFLLNILC